MDGESAVHKKSKAFALKIIALCKDLADKSSEFVLSKQLLRSGTSIGANVREASNAQSRLDFINKLSIALKEAGESEYWLELLFESDYISKQQFNELYSNCKELIKLLTAIINSTKSTMQP